MPTPAPTPISSAEIAAHIATAHARLLAAIAPLAASQLQAPVLAGGWSVKDVLAHLAFWDQRLLHAIDSQGNPDANPLAPPLIADIPYDERWLAAVNALVYERNRPRSLDEVLAEFADTRRRLLAVVVTLSPQAMSDLDARLAALGEPFIPMLLGAYEHYEEHAADLEAHAW